MTKPIRWLLIALCGAFLLFIAPMALLMTSHLVGGVLDLTLNRKPNVTEFIGKYKFKAPWGTSVLHINANGTFEQEIDEQGRQKRNVSGQWQTKDGLNFVSVDFHPFGMVWDDDHERETNIYGINFYKPHLGKTYGLIDDDLGEKFERQ